MIGWKISAKPLRASRPTRKVHGSARGGVASCNDIRFSTVAQSDLQTPQLVRLDWRD